MGTPLTWPYDTLPDIEASRQGRSKNEDHVFGQQILRMNSDDNATAMSARREFETTTQLVTYVGAQALLGSDPTLQASILAARSAGAQPQSGGGPGQPVNFPVQQALPVSPAVYSVNPTTGAITKA